MKCMQTDPGSYIRMNSTTSMLTSFWSERELVCPQWKGNFSIFLQLQCIAMLTLVNQIFLEPFFGTGANQHSRPLSISFNKQKYSLLLCNLLAQIYFIEGGLNPSIECELQETLLRPMISVRTELSQTDLIQFQL